MQSRFTCSNPSDEHHPTCTRRLACSWPAICSHVTVPDESRISLHTCMSALHSIHYGTNSIVLSESELLHS